MFGSRPSPETEEVAADVMAANPIFVESEEEVPGVIDQVRRAGAAEVPLVLPARSRFAQSRFNFQLLRRYAARLGKQVTIISADPVVQRLARESGFATLGSVHEHRDGVQPEVEAGPPAPAGAPSALSSSPLAVGTGGGLEAPVAPRPGAVVPAPPRITLRLPQWRTPAAEVRPGRLVLYAGAALILLAGLAGTVVFVPSAKVTLVAEAKPFSADASVTAEPGRPPVTVRLTNVTKQASGSFKATGQKVIPATPATGTVTYTNGCPFGLQTLNGQRLLSNTGIVFAQKGDSPVMKTGDTVSMPVIATTLGASTNVPANSITGIQGGGGVFSCLTVTNQQPTSGGQDEQRKTIVSQADLDQARATLLSQLQQQATEELQRGVQAGEKLSPEIQFATTDFAADHKVNDEVAGFTATMRLSAEGDYYRPDDVIRAFKEVLLQKLRPDQQLTGKVTADYQITAAGGGRLTFAGKANGYLAPKLDLEAVKEQLVAKSVGQAQANLRRLPVQSFSIQQHPITLPFMPLVGSRIDVEYDVASGLPPPQSH